VTGKPIIQGKKITGFTTQAEHEMGIYDTLRSWKELLVDEHAEALGAECTVPYMLFLLNFADVFDQMSRPRVCGMTSMWSMAES
jgi:hypothetical protein